MTKIRHGSLGYQMANTLKIIFHPGRSRHGDKRFHRQQGMIYSISTMRSLTNNMYLFGRFVKRNYPDTKRLEQVTPMMAQAYIAELVRRERSGGWIGRVCTAIRKLDTASRIAGIFPPEAPPLLPYASDGGPGGFHAQTDTIAYTPEQAEAIIRRIQPLDPAVARLLQLMLVSGLRVQEASYLRARDIELETCQVSLNQKDNANRTKGGRPRVVQVDRQHKAILELLKHRGEMNSSGHLFNDRRRLADRARERVRKACLDLAIPCLGTHGFRKTFAVADYQKHRVGGANDRAALLATSNQLGHNRAAVTRQSYVSADVRAGMPHSRTKRI